MTVWASLASISSDHSPDRLAKLFDDRGAQRRDKLLSDVARDVADQLLDQASRLLLADRFLLGIAVAGISEFCAVERKVNVLGEAADGTERLGE